MRVQPLTFLLAAHLQLTLGTARNGLIVLLFLVLIQVPILIIPRYVTNQIEEGAFDKDMYIRLAVQAVSIGLGFAAVLCLSVRVCIEFVRANPAGLLTSNPTPHCAHSGRAC